MSSPEVHVAPLPNVPRALTAAAALALVTVVAGCASVGGQATSGLAPFTTDGCSLFPDRSLAKGTDWCTCCVVHDLAYWRGGTAEARLQADQDLRRCVQRSTADPDLADLMFRGVRLGGWPYFFTTYRWGYGWPYGRGYEPLSVGEQLQADRLEQAYRERHPTLSCPGDAQVDRLTGVAPCDDRRYLAPRGPVASAGR